MKRRVLIDLETTALTPKRGEILRLYARDLNDPSSTFDQLVKPKRPLSKLVEQITEITNEMIRDAPSLKTAFLSFLEFIDDAELVSDNLAFDLSFVRHAQSRWMRTNQS